MFEAKAVVSAVKAITDNSLLKASTDVSLSQKLTLVLAS